MSDTQGSILAADLRAAILRTEDRVIEPVTIDEWPEVKGLHIRMLTAGERGRYLDSIRETKGAAVTLKFHDATAKLVLLGACDVNGTKVFQESDIPALLKKGARGLERLGRAISKLNGIDEDAQADAKNGSARGLIDDSNTD